MWQTALHRKVSAASVVVDTVVVVAAVVVVPPRVMADSAQKFSILSSVSSSAAHQLKGLSIHQPLGSHPQNRKELPDAVFHCFAHVLQKRARHHLVLQKFRQHLARLDLPAIEILLVCEVLPGSRSQAKAPQQAHVECAVLKLSASCHDGKSTSCSFHVQ